MEAQPQGRPIGEIRAIVEADNRRFWQLGEVWSDLTESQQVELIMTAQAMREGNS